MLACLPGEQHDLGLISFGLALHARGWRVVYLGSDAPVDTVAEACDAIGPSLVVLHAITDEPVRAAVEPLRALAAKHRVALAGAAAASGALEPDVVLQLGGDIVAEAARVTALVPSARG